MDFTQAHVSSTIKQYFELGFRSRWDLEEYSDPKRPCIFFGLYTEEDRKIFLNHKSYSIVIWGGGEFVNGNILLAASKEKCILVGYGWMIEKYEALGIPYQKLIIPVKDYSRFKPSPLGDKIYVYAGIHGNRHGYFKWDSIIKPLMNEYGEDRFIYTSFRSIDELVEEYYSKCFLYIKPNEKGGSTAMWELGLMGRKTVANSQGSLPNVLGYTSINDIKEIIDTEAKKIGTVQETLAEEVNDCIMNTNEWLNLLYYEEYLNRRTNTR